MDFRILGSVTVTSADGRDLPAGPVKRRSLLAMLALGAGAPVTVDQLTEALWETDPPRHSRTVIQGHVSQLRALFAEHDAAAHGVELRTEGNAYLLRTPRHAVDADRFEHLLRTGRERPDPAERVAVLGEALALWRGPALTGTAPSPALECAAHNLEELRLTAVEELAHAHGLLGDHGAAARVLRAEVAKDPLREPLIAALMRALGRAGRRSEALDWFHRTRRTLAEQLGVDPGTDLVDAYDTLLHGPAPVPPPEPAPAAVPAATPAPIPAAAPPPPPVPVPAVTPPTPVPTESHGLAVPPPALTPRLFPRRPRGFSGREDELTALDRATAAPGAIAVVTGSAGVGKTALAGYWAHRRQADFPDGRLFVDLCGYSPIPARDTAAVLRELLLALGVPAEQMPGSHQAMGARYRELTAERRLLLVLDNAHRSEQVRPLLPDGDGCVTVITSRDRLAGLVASDAARLVPLAELSSRHAITLLADTLGPDVVAAEPEAAARLADLCDGLPLALRLAAARTASRPTRGLAALADELADEQRRLSLLNVEDTSVAAALGLTVQQLPESARRMFQRLGTHTGATLDGRTAAAIAGCRLERATEALDQLAAAHLIIETGQDAYTLHDLVRLYARSLPADDDAEALPRLLDHLMSTLLAASAAAEPGSEPCCLLPVGSRHSVDVRPFPDRASALAWYAAERDTLRGAVEAAVAVGLHDRAWRLVLLQWPLIVWQVRDDWTPLLAQGLAAAEACGDVRAQSRARALLGWVLTEEGRHAEALTHLELAPELSARAGDVTGEAVALVNLALALTRHDRLARIHGLLTRARALAERGGRRDLIALTHQHLADHCLTVGAHTEAAQHAARGLALVEPPFPASRQVVLHTLYGRALAATGQPEEAERHLTEAVRIARGHGYRDGEKAARTALAALATLPSTASATSSPA
ncbi:BTAD domain-containing putative transcriptional regulator [Streptomyces sp. Y1]|uniref:BTAD domain-containing putative transcriptional regulator n=1 Tax=Streptomyces sp. Y1 TaxID=3238634 RepID=A0AB39TRU9_9ACTN